MSGVVSHVHDVRQRRPLVAADVGDARLQASALVTARMPSPWKSLPPPSLSTDLFGEGAFWLLRGLEQRLGEPHRDCRTKNTSAKHGEAHEEGGHHRPEELFPRGPAAAIRPFMVMRSSPLRR